MVQPINKAQISALSTLSNLIAELSLHTTRHVTWHVARDKRLMSLHVICTRLRQGNLSVHAGDGSPRSEEIVKNLELRL